jgi:hypothetical protein
MRSNTIMRSSDPCANPVMAYQHIPVIHVPANAPLPASVVSQLLQRYPMFLLPLHARSMGELIILYQWSPIRQDWNFPGIKRSVFTYDTRTELYRSPWYSAAGLRHRLDPLLVDIDKLHRMCLYPLAWTPNGDGHNDYLFPVMVNITRA